MPEKTFSPRLPSIPSWDQVLQHYLSGQTLPDHAHLRSLVELSDPSLEMETALRRSCLAIGRLKKVALVAFIDNSPKVIFSSCSEKEISRIIHQPKIKEWLAKSKQGQTVVEHHPIKRSPVGGLSLKRLADGLTMVTGLIQPLDREEENFTATVTNLLKARQISLSQNRDLSRERGKFNTLIDHLNEGLAILDNNLRVVLWNRQLQQLTGITEAQALGKHHDEVLARLDRPNWLILLSREFRQNARHHSFSDEFLISTPTGVEKWLSVSVSFSVAPNRQIDQAIILARDISSIKQLERRKNEFISIATHELRTPITAIKGYLSLLAREKKKMTQQQQLYLDRATEANDRLVSLAESLLRAAQIEEDRIRINPSSFDLLLMIKRLSRDFAAKAGQKKIKLEVIKPPFTTTIVADEEKTQHIFANLIDNAIKYTSQGWVRIAFTKESSGQGEYLLIEVKDSGIGIKKKYLAEVFEKFRRTHRTDQVNEAGAGLGLFIVKSFIERQGGSVRVQSKFGKGTTFFVRLPMELNQQLLGRSKAGQESFAG